MATNTQNRNEQMYQERHPEMSHNEWPMYEDPAIINPDELATFPKQVTEESYQNYHANLHHGKRTPVRDGRNITRTDNHPEKNGFM